MMKKIILILIASLLFCDLSAQSFQINVTPPARTLLQGARSTSNYSIVVTPLGGYNSTIYMQLGLTPPLYGALRLNTTQLDPPYVGGIIELYNSDAIPPGTHTFVLKSENGPITVNTIISVIIQPASCPEWFVYNEENSPVTLETVCSYADNKGKFWIGSKTLMTFDEKQWEVWDDKGFHVYDMSENELSSGPEKLLDGSGIISIIGQGDTIYALSTKNIYRIVSGSLTVLPSPPASVHWLNKIECDRNGHIWASTQYALHRFDGQTWNTFQFTGAPFNPAHGMNTFEVDHLGNIWIATRSYSLYRFDGNFWTSYNMGGVYDIKTRKNGDVMMITDNGVKVYFGGVFASFFPKNPAFPLTTMQFAGTHVVFSSNAGVLISNADGTQFETFGPSNSPMWNWQFYRVYMASVAPNSSMLVANGNRGIVYKCDAGINVGIHEVAKASLPKVYPNPAGEILNINGISIDPDVTYLMVTDLLGRAFSVPVLSASGKSELLTSALGQGVYILRVPQEDGSTVSIKFIKD